jgi:aminopeptidase-like protein
MRPQTKDLASLRSMLESSSLGDEIYSMIRELYPICSSITGKGFRDTLSRIRKEIPLDVHEVPSGTQVFDWIVPKEWNIRDAYVKNSRGERIIDFRRHNLHVVNYSVPVHRKMSLAELRTHLHTLPDQPDWIPYRTSYYKESWGFCLSHNQLQTMREDEYEVCIDSALENGSLTYGECYLPGESRAEVLISCHACHPSLCNDNLSSVAVATFLARYLGGARLRYSYRFLFIPGTIGAITWLSLKESKICHIKHGLVLAGVGDAGPLSYKKSRRGDTEIDRVAIHVLRQLDPDSKVLEFSPYGYDERQYCSPGINLAVGRLSRTPHGTFPEYHTSADNLDFVHADKLAETFETCLEIFSALENNEVFMNLNPKCEPQLGQRGLYRMVGGQADAGLKEMTMLWVLNLSDGSHSLLDIAERSGIHFKRIKQAALALEEHGLLRKQFKNSQSAAH